jgi:hypothetical protein
MILELDMSAERTETPAFQAPLGALERALIEAFLETRGYDRADLADLPQDKRESLLKEACAYASVRLAEVESRSHFLDEIHDGVRGVPKTSPQ